MIMRPGRRGGSNSRKIRMPMRCRALRRRPILFSKLIAIDQRRLQANKT